MRWDREKLPTPDSHMYGENGAEIMVYNMKRHSKKGGREQNKEKERLKKYNKKKEKLGTIDHTTRA